MAGALRPGRESAVGAGATGAAVVIGGAVRAQAVAASATLPSPSCVTKWRREVARSSEDIASAGGGDAEWMREEQFPIPRRSAADHPAHWARIRSGTRRY